MAKIHLSKEVKAKLEAERQERNKIQIFDLMVRADGMYAANVPGVDSVHFEIYPSALDVDSTDTRLKPGFWIRLKCFDSHADLSGAYLRQVLRIDSEDWEFEVFEKYLDQLQWRADAEKRKIEARDVELHSLSPKQREVLGFGGWRDPLAG